MAVTVEVPTGKVFVMEGPAIVRVGPNNYSPAVGGKPAAPTVGSISPTTAQVGAADLTMTVTGTGFTQYSVIMFGTADVVTTYVSATSLTTLVKPSTATAGVYPVAVRNGGQASSSTNFTFTPAP